MILISFDIKQIRRMACARMGGKYISRYIGTRFTNTQARIGLY